MKLRILVDNNTFIDQYYLGEPGVSYYLEEDGATWLFDTGYSDVFMQNAFAMALPIEAVDGVVISQTTRGGSSIFMNGMRNWDGMVFRSLPIPMPLRLNASEP